MAEITHRDKSGKGKVRAKRISTRIDMTPMVDLAFLLLTFFILTSTFTHMNTIRVDAPDRQPGITQPVAAENVLNLVLAESNKLYWWNGLESKAEQTDYSTDGLRKILLANKSNPKLYVLVKAKDNSRYENLVDVLDEISISKIERYSIADFTDDDQVIIDATRK